MRAHWMLLSVLAATAACRQGAPTEAEAAPSVGPEAAAASGPVAGPESAPAGTPESASAAGARDVEVDNDLYTLEYSWPAEASAIPVLNALLERDLASRRAKLAADAAEGRDGAKQDGYPYRPYGLWVAWQVVRETPDWLSLSAEVSTYTGGAHPNHWFDAILWDKRAGVRRKALDLFVSKAALSAAIRQDFCKALDREREEKRGEPVKRTEDFFGACLDPVDYTVILGSSNRTAFNRIGVLVPPYEAGPYAEGSYEVTLPVTPAVLATVKPQYRASFAVMR